MTAKILKKITLFILILCAVHGGLSGFDLMLSRPGAEAGIAALNGGNYEADAAAITSRIPSMAYFVINTMMGVLFVLMFKKEIATAMKKLNLLAIVVLAASTVFISGCRKPYDKPTFKEIKPYETAFMIQADGNTENQDMFASPEMLQKNLVAAKRVQVPHKWIQTGRKSWRGKWVDSVIFLVVNRTPVTRVWDADPTKGTSKANQALTAESKDSLFVSTGFTLTAYIEPEDAAKFLYKFQGDSLATVIDTQVKNSVQTKFTEECAKYDLMGLPEQKGVMMKVIREDVIPFYKNWGITLGADMGFVGGFVYSDPIQLEIDEVFKAEKSKEKAAAVRIAKDETLLMELNISSNNATIVKIDADARAYAITKEADALKKAGPLYVQVEAINKWDGILSKVSGGETMNMLNLGNVSQ